MGGRGCHCLGSEAQRPAALETEGQAVWPEAGYLTFLGLHFLNCKMELQWDKARGRPFQSQVPLEAVTAAPLLG